MQASLMSSFFSVSVADLVKSRSKTGATPLAEAATETNKLLKRQMAEMFKAGFPFFMVFDFGARMCPRSGYYRHDDPRCRCINLGNSAPPEFPHECIYEAND